MDKSQREALADAYHKYRVGEKDSSIESRFKALPQEEKFHKDRVISAMLFLYDKLIEKEDMPQSLFEGGCDDECLISLAYTLDVLRPFTNREAFVFFEHGGFVVPSIGGIKLYIETI